MGRSRELPSSLRAPTKKRRQLELSNCSVEYLSHPLEVDSACKKLLNSNVTLLGFDMEWRIMYTSGVGPRDVALIQMCYEVPGQATPAQTTGAQQAGSGRLQPRNMNVQHLTHQPSPLAPRKQGKSHSALVLEHQQQADSICAQRCHCLLLHVTKCGFPDALRSVLENSKIAKAGVGIKNDKEKLWLDKRCKLNNIIDINTELNSRQFPSGCHLAEYTTFTLAEACTRLIGRELPKPKSLRCGNWESWPLPSEQRRYAALDALASLRCTRVVMRLPARAKPLVRPVYQNSSDEQENLHSLKDTSGSMFALGACVSQEVLRGRLSL